MRKGKLILISGPSGVGKGSVRKIMEFKDYFFSVSSTTRTIRKGEKNGVHYNFLSKEEFSKKIENGDMLEHASFVDNYYGTERSVVNEHLENGRNVLLEIECQGAIQVLEKMQDVISIFIVPPSLIELENRLVLRGTEDSGKIKKRLEKAEEELKLKHHYQHVVVNENIKKAAQEIDGILFNEIGKNEN